MCVLIYRAPNGENPDWDTLASAWESNPDGAGFAYSCNGAVRYVKGLMTWDAFALAYEKENIPADSHLIVHFRFATHGGKKPGLTHPFPMAGRNVFKVKGEALSVVAHNGILDCEVSPGHSDTSSFILDIMGERKAYFGTGTKGIQYLINCACRGSKVIELTPHGALFYGDAWIEYGEGLYFSNLSFLLIAPYLPTIVKATKGKARKDREDVYQEFLIGQGKYCYYCGEDISGIADLEVCPFCKGEPVLFS